ncbi:hypothetical protein LTR86_002698 [Recurvomyces mirabilis]|nr:hypothetical protein LTR86_002698 [Recurvomyces mirabilis]
MASKLAKAPHQEEREEALAAAPEIPRVIWHKSPNMRKLYFYAMILCINSATTGFDGSMLNAMQFFPTWIKFFNDPEGSRLGLLSAMYSIGSIASLPFVPILSDRFGRKAPIIIGCCIMIAMAAVQASSQNLAQFEAARFFMGFGNSLAQLSSPLLLTEICHPQHRGRVTAVYNCLWNVGALICSWVSFGTQNINNDWAWRTPTLLQGLPSVICITFIWFVPESPRWLLSKDKGDKAKKMLAYYHADNNMDDPTVQFEYEEISETIRLEFMAKKSSSYLDFFRTKGNRYRLSLILTAGLFSQWSGNALTSYYANKVYKSAGVTSPRAGLGLDGGNKVLSLIVSITCALLCDRIGRRPLFLAATGGMLLMFMCVTICSAEYARSGKAGVGYAIILFVWLHGVAYAFAWSGLLVAYTVEVLPFKLRAKGLMIMNVAVQVALVINNYVNPLPWAGAWKHTEWKLYCVYTAWIAFELVVVYFLYVETKGPTLEEIARLFDGDRAEVGAVHTKAGISNDRYDGFDKEENFGEKNEVITDHRAL